MLVLGLLLSGTVYPLTVLNDKPVQSSSSITSVRTDQSHLHKMLMSQWTTPRHHPTNSMDSRSCKFRKKHQIVALSSSLLSFARKNFLVTVTAVTEMGTGDVKNVQSLLPDWT